MSENSFDFTTSRPRTDFKDVSELNKSDARREVESLREGINHHDHLYYVKDHPRISDATYDNLFHRLQALEEAFPELQSDSSPTRRVGAPPLDELEKVEHASPMLSLNSALEPDEVEEFLDFVGRRSNRDKITWVLEPKFDGVSVEVAYENGEFQYGATRGDGRTDEDISANLRTIGAVPLRLRRPDEAPALLAVRGEAYLPKDGFQQMNRERIERGEEPFANPRNAAAGILKRLASREVARWPFDIVFYDLLAIADGDEFENHEDVLRQLNAWGLKTNDLMESCSSLKKIRSYYRELQKQRDELPYEIDGIVIKIDDLALRKELGERHRSPRWALAWKFEPREEITTLEDIVVQVGMTGMLTPVALLQPVEVGGVTVSRATLHNEEEVRRKDVRPGDRVRVARAGDVIPEVVERIKQPGKKRGKQFSMPEKCPVCGSDVVREGPTHSVPPGSPARRNSSDTSSITDLVKPSTSKGSATKRRASWSNGSGFTISPTSTSCPWMTSNRWKVLPTGRPASCTRRSRTPAGRGSIGSCLRSGSVTSAGASRGCWRSRLEASTNWNGRLGRSWNRSPKSGPRLPAAYTGFSTNPPTGRRSTACASRASKSRTCQWRSRTSR